MNLSDRKKIIADLVRKYEQDRKSYQNATYNETLLRSDFLDPFFEVLGWDIKNTAWKTTYEREVILEEGLKSEVCENSKKPDYTFRLFSERKFFLEAKKPSVKIDTNPETAKQVRRYGFTAKLKISVLSNFEHLSIYDCSEKVKESDSAKTALIKTYHYTEYEEVFGEMLSFLWKESVYEGEFDKIWSNIEDKINHYSVDDLFLRQINEWRIILWNEIYRHQPDINEVNLNDTVQSYINSIIFLRVCEDRKLEEYKTLLSYATNGDFEALINKFKESDKKYNSGLFNHPFVSKIISDNKSTFWRIIKMLYYPESPFSFSVFSSDILWNIYEIFLAQKLSIIEGKVILEKKPEHIDRDIITTPTNIIHDILRETIIPFCRSKNDEEILNAKFWDIACGSWAFLLETFQLLNDILIDYYLENDKTRLIQTSISTYKLPFDIKKKLLLACIYWVDKDYNAVQACRFWLLLKLLEAESNELIAEKSAILPNLEHNIFFGNSLLDSEHVSEDCYTDINPFDFWGRKFDVIVWNPPYMKSEDMVNLTPKELPLYKGLYQSAHKQFDKYFLFIERWFGLLNIDWYLGYIVPSKFTKVGSWEKLREFLQKTRSVSRMISFGANQVFKDKTTYTCLLFLRNKRHDSFEYEEIQDLVEWKTRKIPWSTFESVQTATLDNNNWVLIPWQLRSIYNKINSQSMKLWELIWDENIFNGIQTSANRIYIHRPIKEDEKYFYFKKDWKEWKMEKAVTRPYFQTSSWSEGLCTYREFQPNSFVFYPYKKTEAGITFIEIDELERDYPNAFEYIMAYKGYLSDKKRDVKPEPKTEHEWYRYWRHQSLDKCEVQQKIIVWVLSAWNKYAIDRNKTLISSWWTAGYCVVSVPEECGYSIYYIQALLNSKYLEWYASLFWEVFRWQYIARWTKALKNLPIRKIDLWNEDDRALHDSISSLQKELVELHTKAEQLLNPRETTPLKNMFRSKKRQLDADMKKLFNLWEDDSLIPLIYQLYEISN